MNFKQFFTESFAKCTVIRDANENEIADANFYFTNNDSDFLIKPVDKGWIVNCKGEEYMIFPNHANHLQPYINDKINNFGYAMFTKGGEWINYSTDRVPSNILQNSELKRAIKVWDLKKQLTTNTKETFGDLIDEL